MDAGTSATIIGISFAVCASGASVIKTLCGKNGTCNMHGNVMNAIMAICAYVSNKATEEGRDLNKEVRDLMMPISQNKEK